MFHIFYLFAIDGIRVLAKFGITWYMIMNNLKFVYNLQFVFLMLTKKYNLKFAAYDRHYFRFGNNFVALQCSWLRRKFLATDEGIRTHVVGVDPHLSRAVKKNEGVRLQEHL